MNKIWDICRQLIKAREEGMLGQTKMPEDANPDDFETKELRLAYFTLPMALNYQRDSYKLWEAALKTFDDPKTRVIFDIGKVAKLSPEELKPMLLKYKLALQPNKHTKTWLEIARTIDDNWGSILTLMEKSDKDFLKLRQTIQKDFKKGFPYLSGPKIFNYWSFILQEYGKVKLKNAAHIDIAPDTHVIQGSVRLGIINENESDCLSREQISERWRDALVGSGINPIEMHSPLWFWSRNGFKFILKK